eukprot:scaffold706_cov418-Prasinococcus_capsulatus_cf.AAC.26
MARECCARLEQWESDANAGHTIRLRTKLMPERFSDLDSPNLTKPAPFPNHTLASECNGSHAVGSARMRVLKQRQKARSIR